MTVMSPYSSRDADLRTVQGPAVAVTLALLKTLFPVRELPAEVLEAFAMKSRAERHAAGAVLARQGEALDSILYLLDGIVLMDAGSQSGYTVESRTTRSHFPLCASDGQTV